MDARDAAFWGRINWFSAEEWRMYPEKASPEMVVALDHVRGIAGIPIIIHTCWTDGGHSERSYHYTGQAVDFHFADQGQSHLFELLCILSIAQIGGIGFYPGWSPRPGWHADIRGWVDGGRLFWIGKDNKYHYGHDYITDAILEADVVRWK